MALVSNKNVDGSIGAESRKYLPILQNDSRLGDTPECPLFFRCINSGPVKFPKWCKIQAGDKIVAALGVSGAYEKPDALYESRRDGETIPAPHTDVIASAEGRIRRASDGNLS
jgi:hypothetical protein